MLKRFQNIFTSKANRALITSALIALCSGVFAQDKVADNMLLFQRSYGGWPKHYNEKKIEYSKQFSEQEKENIRSLANAIDGTIDNQATVKEIRYLLKAYKQHQNPLYLQAAERGVQYLLNAQHKNGGWPQFFPDTRLYRAQITYNDNAMVNVLNLLQDIVERKKDTEVLNPAFINKAQAAVDKGVSCILNTQVKVNNKLTVWCAQHDQNTLLPANARKFELASLSGSESVGIVEFLMRLPNPSPAVITAVDHAIEWFKASSIKGFEYKFVDDPKQPKGRDHVLVPAAGGTLWARFYDLETNQPFFCGRDGIKKDKLEEIEVERRTGYAWYGQWADDLLNKDYPKWKQKYF